MWIINNSNFKMSITIVFSWSHELFIKRSTLNGWLKINSFPFPHRNNLAQSGDRMSMKKISCNMYSLDSMLW